MLCIIRLCHCCCNIVSSQKRDELYYLDWFFSIYFVIFRLKVLAYMCINRSGDGADEKLPKTKVVASEMVRKYFPWHSDRTLVFDRRTFPVLHSTCS